MAVQVVVQLGERVAALERQGSCQQLALMSGLRDALRAPLLQEVQERLDALGGEWQARFAALPAAQGSDMATWPHGHSCVLCTA